MSEILSASQAGPVVRPVKHGEHTLVDGAVPNPVPLAPTLDDDTELTMAVDLRG